MTVPYIQRGEGIPLVLLNGFSLKETLWQVLPQIEGVAYYQCALPFQESSSFPLHNMQDVLASLHQMFETIPKPFHLMGYSLGGMLAYQYAISYPQDVRSLIMLHAADTFVQSDTNPEGMRSGALKKLQNTFAKSVHSGLEQFLEFATLDLSDLKKEQVKTIINQHSKISHDAALFYLDCLALLTPSPLPHGDRHVIAGTQDPLFSYESCRACAQRINAHLYAIHDAGHFSFLTHAEQLIPLLKELLC